MITLRPTTHEDVDALYEHQADPRWADMAKFPSRDRDAHYAHWRKLLANPTLINRTVLVDGQVAGSLGSWLDDDRRLIGYGLGREFWGRGVATAAVRAFLDEVTERPLFAYVAASNAASIRVLEKNGFKRATKEPEVGEDAVEEWLFRLD